MRFARLFLSILLLVEARANAQKAEPQRFIFRTAVGQPVPSFTVADTSGNAFNIADLKGKVILVNFWATWCGPCSFEIPRLEKEIWRKHKSDNFAMVAIAREQTGKQIVAFRRKRGFTYPIAADPHRQVYKLFANEGIPRSYLIGPDGTIVYQTVGYAEPDFNELERKLEHELSKTRS